MRGEGPRCRRIPLLPGGAVEEGPFTGLLIFTGENALGAARAFAAADPYATAVTGQCFLEPSGIYLRTSRIQGCAKRASDSMILIMVEAGRLSIPLSPDNNEVATCMSRSRPPWKKFLAA